MARPAILIDSGTTHAGESIRRDLTPVRYDGEVIAVLTRAVADAAHRVPSPLERAYHASADDLYQMVADGTFPPDEGTEASCRRRARATVSCGSMPTASSDTRVPTRCRPSTGWASTVI